MFLWGGGGGESSAEYLYFMYWTPSQFYPVNLQQSSCKHVFTINVENKVDHDLMASDLDLSNSGFKTYSHISEERANTPSN